jgi:predicted dehydrogenase
MAGLDAFKENQEVKEIDLSKKVKIGIIGTGWIADSHIGVYKNMPDVEVVALADIVPGKAKKFAEKHGLDVEKINF